MHAGLYLPAEQTGPTQIEHSGLVTAARGCPNHCSYCAFGKIEGHKPKSLRPQQVHTQIEQLLTSGVSCIAYYAPAIFQKNSVENDEAIINGLAGIACDMVGWAEFNPTCLTDVRAKSPREAGFVNLTVPIQTLNRDVTRKWNRRDTLPDHENTIMNLLDAGFSPLEISCDILAGSPDQTLDEIIRSMCWVWAKGLTPTIFPYTWVPGSLDAKRLGLQLSDVHPEQYQPYLFPFAHSESFAHDYIELAKLSNDLDYRSLNSEVFSTLSISSRNRHVWAQGNPRRNVLR